MTRASCRSDRNRGTTVPRRYLDTQGVADYLGVSQQAIRMRVHRRQMPFILIGRRLYFDLRELDKWMQQSVVVGAARLPSPRPRMPKPVKQMPTRTFPLRKPEKASLADRAAIV